MDKEIIIAIITSGGVVLAALIAAWATIFKSVHALDIRLTVIESKLDILIENSIDMKTFEKKLNKNVNYTKLINNKVKNVDKRVTRLEAPEAKKLMDDAKKEDAKYRGRK